MAQTVSEQARTLGLDGKMVWLEGTVLDGRNGKEQTVFLLTDCAVTWKGHEAGNLNRVQVSMAQTTEAPDQTGIWIGDRIAVFGEITEFDEARNPGEFDYQSYYRALKLDYRLKADSWKLEEAHCNWYRELLRRLAGRAEHLLEQITQGADTGVYQAVLLGNQADLDGEVRNLYQRNGIAHLLAVSGLHLSLIGMAAYTLFFRMGAGFGKAGLLGAFMVVSYAVLTGASASILRASIVLLCGFGAAYLGRTYDLLSALGLSAVLVLWDRPYLVTQAGFQLSFGAVFAIGWMAPRLETWLQVKKDQKILRTIIASIAIQLATGPMVLYSFYQFPVYGILLNLIVIPLMAYVLVSGLTGLFLGMWSIGLGRFAIGTGHLILAFYLLLCQCSEKLPYSNLVTGRPQLWRIGLYALWLGILLAAMEKKWPRRRATGVLALGLAVVLLAIPTPVRGLTVTFLDVGQGDGICLRTDQCTILVDGGSSSVKNLGKYRLEPFLKSEAAVKIDYAFVSHGDQDHISGLTWLLSESRDIRIEHLMLPVLGKEDEAYDELIEMVKARGGTVCWVGRGDRLELGELKITCLYPGEEQTAEDRNEQSQVLKVDYGGFHMLLTGDMSERGETSLLQDDTMAERLGDTQVLKIAHHGSRFSSSKEWLDAVKPRWAVVSYGVDNSYGHPHEETMERLEERRIPVFKTGESGAIILWTDGTVIKWRRWLAS